MSLVFLVDRRCNDSVVECDLSAICIQCEMQQILANRKQHIFEFKWTYSSVYRFDHLTSSKHKCVCVCVSVLWTNWSIHIIKIRRCKWWICNKPWMPDTYLHIHREMDSIDRWCMRYVCTNIFTFTYIWRVNAHTVAFDNSFVIFFPLSRLRVERSSICVTQSPRGDKNKCFWLQPSHWTGIRRPKAYNMHLAFAGRGERRQKPSMCIVR